MSLPRYPEYKDSGIDWLEEVPHHWQSCKLKQLCSFTTGWTPPTGDSSAYEGSNLWANISDLGERIVCNTAKRISDEAVAKANIRISPQGILLLSFKLSVGQVSIAGYDMYTNEAIATFKESDLLLTEYAYYALPVFVVRNASENIYGAKLLNQELINSAQVAAPPVNEQRDLVAFLDRETAKIDALIAEQEKLLALLAEKRQATISHAVTHGIDPNAPMKDSGIPWLGAVPAHWQIANIKRLCELITDGAHVSPETEDGAFCFVSTKDVGRDGIDFEGCLLTSAASYEYLVRTGCQPLVGDVLFSKDGTVGRTTVVRDTQEFVVASSLIIIRPMGGRLDPNFLDYLCQSRLVKNQVEGFVKGAGLPRLSIQNLLKVVGVFPPLSEQRRISGFLAECLERSDRLENEVLHAVATLKERRSVLIAAAVTGQIDVRGFVEAQAA